MRSRFVVLIALVLVVVAPGTLAQGAAATAPSEAPPEGTFYYNWETPERLLLWHDLDQMVAVTVKLRNGKWLPEDKQGLLDRLGEEVRKQYPKEEDRAVVQKQWKASLEVALRRSKDDYERWLEPLRLPGGPAPGFIPRQPDVMIYLHVDMAENKARMRLLSRFDQGESRTYELSQEEEGQAESKKTLWTKAGDIPIERAMKVDFKSAEMLKVVGLREPLSADFWTALIDAWKAQPVGSFWQNLYTTKNGETAWAWFEVVDAQALLRHLDPKGPMRNMPTPAPFPPPPAPKPKTLTGTKGDEEVVWLLVAQIWLFASGAFLVIRSYLLSSPVPHAERLKPFLNLEKSRDEFEFQRLRGIESMLDSTYRKWRQSASEEDSLPKQGPTDWLQGILDLLQQADARSTALKAQAEDLQSSLEQAGTRISGLEESERRLTSDLKSQKDLVAEANQSVSKLEGEQMKLQGQRDSLQQALDDANHGRIEAENTLRQEFEAHAARIEALQGDLEQAKDRERRLASDLKGQESLVAEANQKISKLEGEQMKLQGRRDSLQQELADAKRKHTEADKKLREEIETWKVAEANTRRELGVSERTAHRLREELSAARNENGNLRETLQNLDQASQRLEAVGAVDSASVFLRRGQNQFLDETGVQSAGLLALLVTHSLNQLALSRAFNQEMKASAMLWNLHNIASRLAARYSGFQQALARLQELGASNAPLADNLIAMNAQHEDSKLFQLILKQLRTAHRIDLAPFYFDVTRDGQIVRAN